jgi:hypothetical protein
MKQIVLNKSNFSKLFLLLFFILGVQVISFAQTPTSKYIRLEDASGFNTDDYQAGLEKAAADLVATFPPSLRDSFRVYSGGLYLFQSKVFNGVVESLDFLEKKAARTSKYYILFAKKTDSMGIYSDFTLKMNLPRWGVFSCMDNNEYSILEAQINYSVRNAYTTIRKKNPYFYHEAEEAGMKKLKEKIERFVTCCTQGTINTSVTGCGFSEKDMLEYLYSAGFSEIQERKIFRLQAANHQGNFVSPYNLVLKNEEDTTKAYYYTDTLRSLLNEFSAVGDVKGRLSYFSENNSNDFKNFKPLELGTRIFVEDIVLLRFNKKTRMFVNLERKANIKGSSRSVTGVDTRKADSFFSQNEELSCINTLGAHYSLERYAIDGHYSTVYLVGTLMGMTSNTAEDLAIKAEWFDHIVDKGTGKYRIQPSQRWPCNPSTTEGGIFNATPDQATAMGRLHGAGTWADKDKQEEYHGLTGGLQKEVLNHALNKIFEGKPENLVYLHKVGDAYAHIKNKQEKDPNKWVMWGAKIKLSYNTNPLVGNYHSGNWDTGYTTEHAMSNQEGGLIADNIAYSYDIYKHYYLKLIEIFNDNRFLYHSQIKESSPDLSVFVFFENLRDVFTPGYPYIPSIKDRMFMYETRIKLHNSQLTFTSLDEKENKLLSKYLDFTNYPYSNNSNDVRYEIRITEDINSFKTKLKIK